MAVRVRYRSGLRLYYKEHIVLEYAKKNPGHTLGQAAEALDMTVDQVHTFLHNAKHRMMQEMEYAKYMNNLINGGDSEPHA